jgi:hypothetical protein
MAEALEVFHVNHPAHWAKRPMMKVGSTFEVGTDVNGTAVVISCCDKLLA